MTAPWHPKFPSCRSGSAGVACGASWPHQLQRYTLYWPYSHIATYCNIYCNTLQRIPQLSSTSWPWHSFWIGKTMVSVSFQILNHCIFGDETFWRRNRGFIACLGAASNSWAHAWRNCEWGVVYWLWLDWSDEAGTKCVQKVSKRNSKFSTVSHDRLSLRCCRPQHLSDSLTLWVLQMGQHGTEHLCRLGHLGRGCHGYSHYTDFVRINMNRIRRTWC